MAALPGFVVAVVLISASPGPAMTLVLRRASVLGFRSAIATVAGLEVGLYAWALVVAAGFATVVGASPVAYVALQVIGTCVLLYLGGKALWAAASPGSPAAGAVPAGSGDTRPLRLFSEGLLVQLANPKAAMFLLALYPQFVPPGRPLFATTALLGLLQVGIETVLYGALAAGVAKAGTWLRRPRTKQWLEGVSGLVLLALAVRLALSSR